MTMPISATSLSLVERHRTFQAMQKYGGGFCVALAAAWFLGDARNRARIELAFPHLLEQFGPHSRFYAPAQAGDDA